jgi:hypothetical protein
MTFPRRIFSPIHSLPVELLSYIFVLTTHEPTTDSDGVSITADSVKVPIILSRVNRKWRTVAHRTPTLWTSICVTCGLLDDTEPQSVLDTRHLETSIKHSKNQPLDILIDARDYNWDFSEPGYVFAFHCSFSLIGSSFRSIVSPLRKNGIPTSLHSPRHT